MPNDKDATEELPRPFGPYTLLRRIAAGGMAEVFAASGAKQGPVVAIKLLHEKFSEDPRFEQMFVDEAKLSALLQHPAIVETLELGAVGDRYFIVMEYVDGIDLSRLQRRLANAERRLPIDVALYIIVKTLEALDYAHTRIDEAGEPLGIVHRDVSPQNILLSFAGEVKLVDFGIAKAESRSSNTEIGVIKGKYVYMSPEQAWGDPVDRRADVFSAGVVLHELLTGAYLYAEAPLPELLDRVREAEISPPSALRVEVSPELDAICLKALAPMAADRFESARAFREALEDLLYRLSPGFSAASLAALVGSVTKVPSVPPPVALMPETARIPAQTARRSLTPIELPSEEPQVELFDRSAIFEDAGEVRSADVTVAEPLGPLAVKRAGPDPGRMSRGRLVALGLALLLGAALLLGLAAWSY